MLVLFSRSMLNNNIIDRIKLPFRKDKELFSSLYDIMGFYPHHIEYYKLALMHKSVARRNDKGKPLNNERLEFLGDAVLDAVVGDIVYRHFEGKREGFLTNTRSKLVQRDMLNKLAGEMGIPRLIKSSGHNCAHNNYMGGNAFEALVGAIYLDRGYDACMRFMQKRILAQLVNIDKVAYKVVNFKSKLIEWTQKNKVSMEFMLAGEEMEKDNVSPVFISKVSIEGLEAGTGRGYSKKESQQAAAKEALQRLRKEPQFIGTVFAAKAERVKAGTVKEKPARAVADDDKPIGRTPVVTLDTTDTIQAEPDEKPVKDQAVRKERRNGSAGNTGVETVKDEFDLSDITANPKEPSREDIIAAAEAAAYE